MYVCMYVRTYVCMYECMYVYVCIIPDQNCLKDNQNNIDTSLDSNNHS